MLCIANAHVITTLYPKAKATIVTELVNQEDILLATIKALLVLAMKLPLLLYAIDQTLCGYGFSALFAVGVVKRTGQIMFRGIKACKGLGPFY